MNYNEKIINRVKYAIKKGEKNFGKICQYCDGAFPLDVLSALYEINKFTEIEIYKDSSDIISGINSFIQPEPHPIDYDWRFTLKTAKLIVDYIRNMGNKIALFGVPSIYNMFNSDNNKITLFDRNPFFNNSEKKNRKSKVITQDLSQPLSQKFGYYDVIVMDPPWYADHYESWLENALKLSKNDSIIIITLFPPLIRPSASEERERLLNLFAKIGNVYKLAYKVEYETPIFEIETLKGLNLPILKNWRLGDLYSIHVKNRSIPYPFRHPKEPDWNRYCINSQIIAIKEDPSDNYEKLEVKSIYEDGSYLLRSVSARETIREKIDFWTSRNRCLSIKGRKRLKKFLFELTEGTSPGYILNNLSKDDDERDAINLIIALIGL